MRKQTLLAGLGIMMPFCIYGQSAIDAYRISQPDLKGTARFMSMGGAFGALGGDLSSLSQNPAGIGVYRSNEVGFTLDLDCQKSTSSAQGYDFSTTQTKFLLNNIGGVATLRLNNDMIPNINFGFTYNKGASFNRKFAGRIPRLSNSLSNVIAGISNVEGIGVGDVMTTDNFDPYNPNDGLPGAPWLSILGYDSFLTTPTGDPDNPYWEGQWGKGTSGSGTFSGVEKGSLDEFNIAIGGNINNIVFWGMDFDIINLSYQIDTNWGEALDNAYVESENGNLAQMQADWNLYNYYRVSGSGFNYKIGLIVKPIQELRIGVAFHTPTWMNLNETYYAELPYSYTGNNVNESDVAVTNQGYDAYNSMSFRTPLKFIGSIAGVLFNRLILSADYEFSPYSKMKYSEADSYGGYYDDFDWYPDWEYWNQASATRVSSFDNDPYYYTNQDIKKYYQTTSTLRVGAEFRVTPRFSVRAGYSFTSSPVKSVVRDNREVVYTAGTLPSYNLDNTTQYVTCGLGYRWKHFYADLAYVYKHLGSTYHAYTSDPDNPNIPSPQSSLSFSNSQVVLSCGVRF